ncbi:MAG: sigma-E processing peptidase SpoIIGA [Lachnospiraceae bacterium]|nr:sigma-E processing peptidase SpoIIGA [Lachnospiraceae bacterium]
MKRTYCKVTLEKHGIQIPVTALLDTGNFLVEPISGKPVSVLEETYLAGYLPESEWEDGFRLIPYRSVGRRHGLMRGLIFDRMEVRRGRKCACVREPVIGLVRGILGGEKGYQMLLNMKML